MRLSRDRRRAYLELGFNATPMIDVFFLLTIFFMLVSRFSSAEQVPMQLPEPVDSRAKVKKLPERVVINCRLADSSGDRERGVLYSIGPNRPEPLEMIDARLTAMKVESPEIKVVVRADRRLEYDDVRIVMRIIAKNGIEMLNVIAHVADDE